MSFKSFSFTSKTNFFSQDYNELLSCCQAKLVEAIKYVWKLCGAVNTIHFIIIFAWHIEFISYRNRFIYSMLYKAKVFYYGLMIKLIK